jgi:hypothetical protein
VDYDDRERRFGFVRARLRLVAAEDGGTTTGVWDDYRPNWGVGERLSGDGLIAGAPITVEGADAIAPGETGIVHLHPTYWDAWADIRVGQSITMLEGARIVGVAEVLEVVRRPEVEPGYR